MDELQNEGFLFPTFTHQLRLHINFPKNCSNMKFYLQMKLYQPSIKTVSTETSLQVSSKLSKFNYKNYSRLNSRKTGLSVVSRNISSFYYVSLLLQSQFPYVSNQPSSSFFQHQIFQALGSLYGSGDCYFCTWRLNTGA